MHALVYEGVRNVAYRAWSVPELQPGEVLVQIEATGICGSDLHAFLGHDLRRSAGAVLGHEAVGKIVSGSDTGLRVVIFPSIHCGECVECLSDRLHYCLNRQQIGVHRQGTFADYIAVPSANLIAIDGRLSAAAAAVVEPLAVAVRAARTAVRLSAGRIEGGRALVIGGGAIGLLSALLLQNLFAARTTVCEISGGRRETCRSAGMADVLDPAAIATAGAFEVVLDAVGTAESRRSAQKAVARGGVVVHVGLAEPLDGIDFQQLTRDEVTLAGSIRASRDDFMEAISVLSAGNIGALDWVETRKLRDGPGAFGDLEQGIVRAAKVVLLP